MSIVQCEGLGVLGENRNHLFIGLVRFIIQFNCYRGVSGRRGVQSGCKERRYGYGGMRSRVVKKKLFKSFNIGVALVLW